jgi:hypothetical protein
MTIQRQYSLPNCTLTLEGFGDGTSNAFDLRPVMAILTSAECKLVDRVLRGGKDFLEGLMIATSRYAQEILSEFMFRPRRRRELSASVDWDLTSTSSPSPQRREKPRLPR